MKINVVLFALIALANASPAFAMEESESWNCEIFSFASQLLKEALISIRFKCGESAASEQLFTAIRDRNSTAVATLLQEHSQLIDSAEDADGMTPLLAATIQGSASLITQMLNRVPQPQVDRAAFQGFALVKHKDSSAWQPLTGFTPLMAAAKYGHRDIAVQLLNAGAQKDLKDESSPRKTALDYAKENGNNVALVNLLQ
ncbi:hypothetical protein BH09DEP1_BH09DEP1_2860 [soil metagenome]